MSFYEKIYRFFAPLVTLLYRIEARGVENIPGGGVLLAANHTAFSDVLVISAAARRQVRYMAKKELFATPLAPLIKALGAYPVNRSGDVGSIRRTIHLLENGKLVGIFPQGHRYGGRDPKTTPHKDGVGMIAYHAKTPVVPVLICNSRMKTGMFRKNTVIFGAPIPYEELGFVEGGKAEYAVASKLIFEKICGLADGGET